MCSQVSWVKVTCAPACSAFTPLIQASTSIPPPSSCPTRTPQTSVLILERACRRIWRTTSLPIAIQGRSFSFSFDRRLILDFPRQDGSQHQRRIAVRDVSHLVRCRTRDEKIQKRQSKLIKAPVAEVFASR